MHSFAWKLMVASEIACQTICMRQEAADHYGEKYSTWDSVTDWLLSFLRNWPR